jgi:hypothetical protein
MKMRWWLTLSVVALIEGILPVWAEDPSSLRLAPFPKQVRLEPGAFALNRQLTLEVNGGEESVCTRLLKEEWQRAGLPRFAVRPAAGNRQVFRLSAGPAGDVPPIRLRDGAGQEDYGLEIRPEHVVGAASDAPGLLYAAQTLCQLVRANRRSDGLPCLSIRDWPSLRWRCFQDDMTRGPSPKMAVLKLQAEIGSYLKMNLFTYYMECQFAFQKHPAIGPPKGSLTPEELAALVAHAKPLHVDVLGNQQSFGHFGNILKHNEYARLRETGDILCPVREESYQLLDDMYGEVCPLVPFPFFNVCCDETFGLGTGPSKELAKKIGEGGVYVGHIRRIHDLLKEKHRKRMMMWGDIILAHPKHLDEIPKDTIMLTWAYDPRPNFEGQIVPFSRSGYEFFVCPGVSNWSRILPDFACAETNIRNFVRDGAKHGALGMINTDWEDDGESLNAPTWHGDAWGAECAWNASTTTPQQFNRRIGAVLFGEKGDHFGQAIELLAQTHRMAGMKGMMNGRFWDNDFAPTRRPESVRASAERLLAKVRPAIEQLNACRQEATVNAELLDAFLFGARRMELIGQRMIDGLEATLAYHDALRMAPQQALPLLAKIDSLVRKNRDAHEALGKQFAALWLTEAKPYALDWTMRRYAGVVKWYDDLGARLATARKRAEAGQALPEAQEVGLPMPEAFARRLWPQQTSPEALAPDSAWTEPSATHRLGLVVRAGPADRFDLPVELEIALPAEAANKPVRAFRVSTAGQSQELLAQLDPAEKPHHGRLTLLLPGPLARNSEARVHVYLGLAAAPPPLPQAVSTRDAPQGMKWIENDKVRLLLGPEGAHVYRWEVKSLAGRDLTMPGETNWSGFSDLTGEYRNAKNSLTCTARGPALVRYRCSEPAGLIKEIGLFGGVCWMEVVLNEGVGNYWDFDNPKNFAADGPTPGKYLFSDGRGGAVGKESQGVAAQVQAPATHWAVKYNGQKLALGLATPEAATRHLIAPGSGAGGVGIESSPEANHFVTYAGPLEAEPAATMARLCDTLSFKVQPMVVLHAVQPRANAAR